MYTQCEHCKAIFRVNIREVTVAKGKLQCGECKEIFNANKSLSTTLPDKFHPKTLREEKNLSIDELHTVYALDEWQAKPTPIAPIQKNSAHSTDALNRIERKQQKAEKTPSQPTKIQHKNRLIITLVALTLLLLTQILYNNRLFFSDAPKHEPEKIKMLKHNIFVHPYEKDVLLLSATIKNTATHAQPYPLLEVRLTNAQSNVISLRRFKPEEYLENYSESMLLPVNKATSLQLRIRDPGNKATRFQFDFL